MVKADVKLCLHSEHYQVGTVGVIYLYCNLLDDVMEVLGGSCNGVFLLLLTILPLLLDAAGLGWRKNIFVSLVRNPDFKILIMHALKRFIGQKEKNKNK